MWVFTTRGFFSVVAHREREGHVLVRARVESDLERLRDWIPGLVIEEDAAADYRFRTVMPAAAWGDALRHLAGEIDYPNFKAEVDEWTPMRARLYQRVWEVMRGLPEAVRKDRFFQPGAGTSIARRSDRELPTEPDGEAPSLTDTEGVDSVLRMAMARVATTLPLARSLLERAVEQALAHELDRIWRGRVETNRRVDIPDWNPKPGNVDLLLFDASHRTVKVAAELKVQDVDQCLWDVFKLMSVASGHGCLTYVVAAGRPRDFELMPLFRDEPGLAEEHRTAHLFAEHREAWSGTLRGGRGRPLRLPRRLTTVSLGSVPFRHWTDWSLRAIRVAPDQRAGWLELEAGWPSAEG